MVNMLSLIQGRSFLNFISEPLIYIFARTKVEICTVERQIDFKPVWYICIEQRNPGQIHYSTVMTQDLTQTVFYNLATMLITMWPMCFIIDLLVYIFSPCSFLYQSTLCLWEIWSCHSFYRHPRNQEFQLGDTLRFEKRMNSQWH